MTKPTNPVEFAKTLETLKAPIDPALIKTREGWRDRQGNAHLVEFVEWHTVADLLDTLAPEWSSAVKGIVQIGECVAVTCAITIDGVTREGVGTGTAANETGIKKAEHDALKRAAVKFGIARELYQRESDLIEASGSKPLHDEAEDAEASEEEKPPPDKRKAEALSMADLVTPKQLGMIRALAREAGVEPDAESMTLLGVKHEALSKRAASSLIDHLKTLNTHRK